MMSATRRRYPGDLTHEQEIHRMIRVNHAGEFGARRIYAGQLAVLGKQPCGETIRDMAEQEEKHLQTFETMISERQVRPTALMPLWNVAGYALGAATALMGEKAAMACTVAVETVIADHYQAQHDTLEDSEQELKDTVKQFREEELEHHDTGLAHGAEDTPFYSLLNEAVQRGTRCAIWLSKRV